MGIELTNDQIYACMDLEHWWNIKDSQLYEISGEAGTGKTTLVKYFIDRMKLDMDEVLFVAYMGKAVSVLQRNGIPAKTIHSAIYDYKVRYVKDENGHIVLNNRGKPVKESYFELKEKLPHKIKLIVIDEASMVNEKIGKDLLSFNLPIITLGDLNQLPPVFGNPFFLKKPNTILRQIMRQSEGDPIIWLAHEILDGHNLNYGVYNNSAVIRKSDLNEFVFKNSDIVLTATNALRYKINNLFRENFNNISKLEYPNIGEKIVCRKNNWDLSVNGSYMTNGTTGYVDEIYRDSFNGNSMKIDFRPDFSKHKPFKGVKFDYYHLMNPNTNKDNNNFRSNLDIIEFAYALTCWTAQGSQWDSVLFIFEPYFTRDKDLKKKLLYTGITRAAKQITVVI